LKLRILFAEQDVEGRYCNIVGRVAMFSKIMTGNTMRGNTMRLDVEANNHIVSRCWMAQELALTGGR